MNVSQGRSQAGQALPVYFVNAFAGGWYRGNTAAVVLLEEYPPDAALLALAREFGFSETAFLRRMAQGEYRIRWFTPEVEVPLCGHATLASAAALFELQAGKGGLILFQSLSGPLSAKRMGESIELDFPSDPPQAHAADPAVLQALSQTTPRDTLFASGTRNLVVVYADPRPVLQMQPDFGALAAFSGLPYFGIAVTAPGVEQDYICRYFAPWEGINEDPVTGSAQTCLAPYWSERLDKPILRGFQASARGGAFEAEVAGSRVLISGRAFIYLRGEVAPGWSAGETESA
ncbi:MAG TPA: PhzF family phenazine biosynthesis protein [Candidatus Syntrophosphaera sp.]|nr:PhzF family phenazine biosynthesis protein [Candidatus Syntrophosphaera sp.]